MTARRELFGNRLRELRQEHGWSQATLAAEAGIDRSFLAEVETAKVSISLDRLIKLADVFGLSLEELFRGIP